MKKPLLSTIIILLLLFSSTARSETVYKISRVLVSSEDEAINIIDKLNQGMLFSQNSFKLNSISTPIEDIGWHYLDEMESGYYAIKELKKDDYTKKPIKSWMGYIVAKIDDLKEEERPSLNITESDFFKKFTIITPKINGKENKNNSIYKTKNSNIELKLNILNNATIEDANINIKDYDSSLTSKKMYKILPTLKLFIEGSNPNISEETSELLALELFSSLKRIDQNSVVSGVSILDTNYVFSIIQKEEDKIKYLLFNLTAESKNSSHGKISSHLTIEFDATKNKKDYISIIDNTFH